MTQDTSELDTKESRKRKQLSQSSSEKKSTEAKKRFKPSPEEQKILADLKNSDPRLYSQAYRTIKKLAKKGNLVGFYGLGLCFEFGYAGVTPEKTQAYWYTKAAEQGLAEAQFQLAESFCQGVDNPEDLPNSSKIFKLYLCAAKQGHCQAQLVVATSYRKAIFGDADHHLALRYYEKAAHQNNPEAQFWLGVAYEFGNFYEDSKEAEKAIPKNTEDYSLKDFEKAVRYYTLAADQGFPLAQVALGLLYDEGDKVTRDTKKAAKYYTSAEMQDRDQHVKELASRYKILLDADELMKEDPETIEIKRKAAEIHLKGFDFFENGKRVPQEEIRFFSICKNLKLGEKFCQWAAERGDQAAQAMLKDFESEKTRAAAVKKLDLSEASRFFPPPKPDKKPEGTEGVTPEPPPSLEAAKL
ncbi:MAG: tetratricopeptide repeat protein [Gammaproteobacteria bacterium]